MKRFCFVVLLAIVVFTVSCVQVSGDTWLIRSAKTPQDWPAPTPVGHVKIQQYPAHRAAVTQGDGTKPMFRSLFNHIRNRDISMTAPVDMGYAGDEMASMAFLYRSSDLGSTGQSDAVTVVDRKPQTFASVGVRGDYTRRNFEVGLALVEAWLAKHAGEWRAAGSPRYLGYNGPFVPKFMRYGEVQIPVEKRS